MTQQITPILVPVTNGFVQGFANVRLNAAGMDFTGGFQSIKRSRKRDRELVESNSVDPVGKTLGMNKYQCSAIFLYAWFLNFIKTINNNLGAGYADQPFTIYIGNTQDATGLVTSTDIVLGCTLDSTDADDVKGIGALTRPIEFNPIKIKFNGLEDAADPLGP